MHSFPFLEGVTNMRLFVPEQCADAILKLLPYIPYTLLVVIVAMFLSSLFGLLLAYMKLSGNKVAKSVAVIITEMVRGTPFLILLFVVFYALPELLKMIHINMDGVGKLTYLFITLTLFSGSRLAEVFRSAYEAVDSTQMEAAVSCGLSGFQAFYRIILPQAFYIALPNLGNSLLAVLMETSLGYTIGLVDIMGKAKLINSFSYSTYTLEIYLAVALIYWFLSFLIDRLFGTMEQTAGKPYKMVTDSGKGEKT